MRETGVGARWAKLNINLKDVKEHTTQGLRKEHVRAGNMEKKSLR